MKSVKTVGKRVSRFLNPLQALNQLQKTMIAVRGTSLLCPGGVYRFKTHEEADEWMNRMIIQTLQKFRR